MVITPPNGSTEGVVPPPPPPTAPPPPPPPQHCDNGRGGGGAGGQQAVHFHVKAGEAVSLQLGGQVMKYGLVEYNVFPNTSLISQLTGFFQILT